jgi:hypothetical protein
MRINEDKSHGGVNENFDESISTARVKCKLPDCGAPLGMRCERASLSVLNTTSYAKIASSAARITVVSGSTPVQNRIPIFP